MGKDKIIIENLDLHIGKAHILKNINTTIPEKKITVILFFCLFFLLILCAFL